MFMSHWDFFSKDQLESTDTLIHPSAVVSKTAQIGKGVKIAPFAIVGGEVKLDDGVQVGCGAVLGGDLFVGKDTVIFPYATVGSLPQDLKYKGEDTKVIIGERNRIREYVNISLGTNDGGGITRIGDDNLLMCYTHIAHDCQMGSSCIVANGVQIAGHVVIGEHVVIGGLAAVHQFCLLGDLAMIGGGAMVAQDVFPFSMVQGDRATMRGLNVVGLRRSSYKNISVIKKMYSLVFKQDLALEEALRLIKEETECQEQSVVISFLEQSIKSGRGLVR